MSILVGELLESMINHMDNAKVVFIESDGSAEYKKFLCEKWDEEYNRIKEELWKRKLYFISIKEDKIEIYVRPEGWKKK